MAEVVGDLPTTVMGELLSVVAVVLWVIPAVAVGSAGIWVLGSLRSAPLRLEPVQGAWGSRAGTGDPWGLELRW